MTDGNTRNGFVQFCSTISIHGLTDLCQAGCSHLHRVFWSIIVFCVLVAGVIQISTTMYSYVTPPYFQTYIKPQEQTPHFPNVIVCNENVVNYTKAKAYGLDDDVISAIVIGLQFGSAKRTMPWGAMRQRIYDAWDRFYENPSNLPKSPDALLQLLAHNCEQTFVRCGPQNIGIPEFDCCKFAKPTIIIEHGLCWELTIPQLPLQPNASFRQFLPGFGFGARVELNPGVEHYPSKFLPGLSYVRGMEVQFSYHSPVGHFYDPLVVAAGQRALVSFVASATVFDTDNDYFHENECIPNGELGYLKGDYHPLLCQLETLMERAAGDIGCMPPTIEVEKRYPQIPSCNITRVQQLLAKTNYQGIDWLTSKKCPPPCEKQMQIRYFARVNEQINAFDVDAYKEFVASHGDILTNNTHLDNLLENIVLDLYFPELSVTVYETVARTGMFQQLSILGGGLGLWFGGSLVTVIQVLWYATGSIWSFIRSKLAKANVLSDKNSSVQIRSFQSDLVDYRPAHS